jgi:kinesin family protein 2/24
MQVVVTFFEIYCGKLFDLLNNRNLLQIREDKKGNINVIGLNENMICSAE